MGTEHYLIVAPRTGTTRHLRGLRDHPQADTAAVRRFRSAT
ncbi:hypothetical protein [Phaeacidiphilus oryzae]|nr:hypothetical protein [Phaeacidiphilus oryzae]